MERHCQRPWDTRYAGQPYKAAFPRVGILADWYVHTSITLDIAVMLQSSPDVIGFATCCVKSMQGA